MTKAGRNKPYHWGRPNPDYTGPEVASASSRDRHAAAESAKSDFLVPDEPSIPEDPEGRDYDRAPSEPPTLPDFDAHYSPDEAATYARRALEAAASRNGVTVDTLKHGDGGEDGGAAVLDFDSRGELTVVGYGIFNESGRLDSIDDEPALVRLNGAVEWYRNGYLHREDGPAARYADPVTGEPREVSFLNGENAEFGTPDAPTSEDDIRSEYARYMEMINMK